MTTTPPEQPEDEVPSRFSVDLSDATLLGVYRVERKLADGGMGSIYLAEDTNLGRPVVVKVPHPRFLGEPGFRKRFAQEVAELVRLEHPHIVRILARGEHEELPFFVLQFLGGGSLEDRLEQAPGKLLPPAEIADWLRTTAATLDFVHGRGIVHRDIKPENILFDEEGHVFVSDFGVAKVLESEGVNITATGTGIGSPLHMAPEQGMGQNVGPAADQYGLASTVYQVLSGRPPFGAEKTLQALIRKGREDPPPLGESAPDLPPPAAAAVMKALSRDPGGRFQSCAAFADAFLAGIGLTTCGTPADGTPVTLVTPAAPAPHRRAVHRTPAAVGLTLAVLAVVIWLAVRGAPTGDESGQDRRGTAPAPADPAPDPETARVTLVEAGAEPRTLLRYSPAAGSRERIVMKSTSEMSFKMGDQEMATPGAVPMSLGSDVLVDEVTADGDIKYRWIVTSCEAPESFGGPMDKTQILAEMFKRLVGLTARGRASDRGLVSDVQFEDLPDQTDEKRQFLQSLTGGMKQQLTPLPVEPVGAGAQWEVTEVVSHMGMRLTQTTTYELISLEGYRATIHTGVAQTAPPQSVAPPGFPPETDVRLTSFYTRGEGDVVQNLTQLVPESMRMEVVTDMAAGVVAEDEEKQEITMHFKVITEMERR